MKSVKRNIEKLLTAYDNNSNLPNGEMLTTFSKVLDLFQK